MEKYYAAYGSNLNIERMKRRCSTAQIYAKGMIKDYRLLFKGSKTGSFLTIEKAKGYSVPVAIWKIGEIDEEALDVYEGYPTFYYKKDFELDCEEIKTGQKKHIHCFAYIMHEDRKLGIPSAPYLAICLEGYEQFGFESKHLNIAYRHSLKGGKI